MNKINYFKELEEKYDLDKLVIQLIIYFEETEFKLPQIIPNYEFYSTYHQLQFRGFLLSLLHLNKVIIVSKCGNGDYTYKMTSKI